MTNRSQLTERQRHLPDVDLISSNGTSEPLMRHGRALLLIMTHDASCLSCFEYLKSLSRVSDELSSWDMEAAVISTDASAAEIPFRCFLDADRRFADATGIEPPAVMVVDQWRDVKELYEAGVNHNFPEAEALMAWARYLATQCPECEGESL